MSELTARPLASPRGPLTTALGALLSGPPTGGPAMAAEMLLGDLTRARNVPWWRCPDDAALALVELDQLRRHGLRDIDDGWRAHPLLDDVAESLAVPVDRGLALLAGSVQPMSGCDVVRQVLGTAAASEPPPRSALDPARPERLAATLRAAVAQAVREREAAIALLGATPEPDSEIADEVLDLLGVGSGPPLLDALPGAALWRLAVTCRLATNPALLGPALGWLCAATALGSSGRLVTGVQLRAHGVDRGVARAWDAYHTARHSWPALEAVERFVDGAPRAAGAVLAGARAAVRATCAVEQELRLSWSSSAAAPPAHDPTTSSRPPEPTTGRPAP